MAFSLPLWKCKDSEFAVAQPLDASTNHELRRRIADNSTSNPFIPMRAQIFSPIKEKDRSCFTQFHEALPRLALWMQPEHPPME